MTDPAKIAKLAADVAIREGARLLDEHATSLGLPEGLGAALSALGQLGLREAIEASLRTEMHAETVTFSDHS